MSIVRIGDIIRDRHGADHVLIRGHALSASGIPCAWDGLHFPTEHDTCAPFELAYAYDFAEQDALTPGGMMPADAWSCWTEEI